MVTRQVHFLVAVAVSEMVNSIDPDQTAQSATGPLEWDSRFALCPSVCQPSLLQPIEDIIRGIILVLCMGTSVKDGVLRAKRRSLQFIC